MTVYLIVNRETDAIALRRVFATAELAEKHMLKITSWIASEEAVRAAFEVAPAEVETE